MILARKNLDDVAAPYGWELCDAAVASICIKSYVDASLNGISFSKARRALRDILCSEEGAKDVQKKHLNASHVSSAAEPLRNYSFD